MPAVLCQKLLLSAGKLFVDIRTKDVKPAGATTPYASPELLYSIQRQWEGDEDDEEGVMINGPAADIWSFGCVCYQMLTGDLPFLADHKSAISAPDVLAEELHPAWEEYEAMIESHRFWVRLYFLYHDVTVCLADCLCSCTCLSCHLVVADACTACTGCVCFCKCSAGVYAWH